MKKSIKKALGSLLTASMVLSGINFSVFNVQAAVSLSAGGWYETLFVESSDLSDKDVTAVSWSGKASGSLTGDDLTYLVRDTSNGLRIDIPGLTPGTYNVSVTANSTTYSATGIEVYEYDRTGYAHKDSGGNVGAYNDDGTLKSNAVVVYVNDSNKNSVFLPGIKDSPVGIGNILNYKSTDTGSTGSGKIDALQTLANSDTPLVVRFIGSVYAGDANTRGSVPSSGNVLGLTQYNGTGNGGTVKDNGMVARMFNAQNVTIEGIGTDAVIDGWGFQVISGTARPSKSIEMRNLTFKTTPEDAIGFEGTCNKSTTLTSKEWLDGYSPIKFCWVHNCTFEAGYCKNPAESDKAEGDGSLDFKRGYGFTASYNHYIENHKTNLIGSSSDSVQFDVTYHHNYYDQVWSRQPLTRQANVHIYNSYFKNGSGTSYIISPRAYCYILSEANYYENCKNPVDSPSEGGGYVKSYNDNFSACTGNNYATVVTNKNQAISGNNHPYKSDFDGSFPYSYTATDALQAKADCIAKSGVMKASANIDMDPQKISILSEYPSAPIALPYTLDLSATYTAGRTVVNNAILNAASKSTAGSVKIRDNGLIFTVNQQAVVSFTSGASSKYGMVLMNEYGGTVASIADSGSSTIAVDPGTYVLKSGNIEKDAYLEAFKVVAVSGSETVTVTTQKVETTTEATTKQVTTSADTPTETTTVNDNEYISGEGYIWNYTTGENTNNFFYVAGNDYTSTKVTYQGATLSRAVKMEDSTDIHFDTDTDGTLLLYTYSKKSAPTVKINDTEESISANGTTTFTIGDGQSVYITKGTTDTYIYFMQFIPKNTSTPTTEATTEATTKATTEATTKQQSQTSTETTTETTTVAPTPDSAVNIKVDNITAQKGTNTDLTISAEDSGNSQIGGYIVALKLDSGLTYNSVSSATTEGTPFIEDYVDGNVVLVSYVGSVAPNSPLFKVNLKATKSGTLPVTVISQQLINTDAVSLLSSATAGSVNVAFSTGSGDVYKDGYVNDLDAAYLLKYLSGVTITDSKFDISEGNCDGKGDTPDMLDVIWILNNKTQASTETTTEATTVDEASKNYISSFNVSNLTSDTLPSYLKSFDLSTHKNNNYPVFTGTEGKTYTKRLTIPNGKSFTFDVKAGQSIKLYLSSADNASKASAEIVGSSKTYASSNLPGRNEQNASPVTFTTEKNESITVTITGAGAYLFEAVVS